MSKAKDVRPKPVKIQLDKARTLVYDLNAFVALEDLYGDVDKALAEFEKGSIKALRAVLWAGLVHEDESLTPLNAGSFIGMADIERVSEAMLIALEGSMPEADGGPGNPPPPEAGE